ncbi:unnamed protein product [Ostreobium quekettii]|uniref:Uncharacterized protein n=1 Tax=Ostreobium quekettii TaxID=121088 RepID=A0A8S1JCX3_9CHLO|nr:unnamed protein product [Ostreobium quekettii]|eukprot:evm.model.scf_584.2 EVM.evm.TU.scf_584.2   scf_584:16677-17914(+)
MECHPLAALWQDAGQGHELFAVLCSSLASRSPSCSLTWILVPRKQRSPDRAILRVVGEHDVENSRTPQALHMALPDAHMLSLGQGDHTQCSPLLCAWCPLNHSLRSCLSRFFNFFPIVHLVAALTGLPRQANGYTAPEEVSRTTACHRTHLRVGISESQQAMSCSAGKAFSRHTRESAARRERQRQRCSPSARSSERGAGKRQGSHARRGDAQHKTKPARQQPATAPRRNVGIFESQQQAMSSSAGDAFSCHIWESAAGNGQ